MSEENPSNIFRFVRKTENSNDRLIRNMPTDELTRRLQELQQIKATIEALNTSLQIHNGVEALGLMYQGERVRMAEDWKNMRELQKAFPRLDQELLQIFQELQRRNNTH